MRLRALDFLVCPDCHVELAPSMASGSDDEILEGSLECMDCECLYPIVRGVPRFPFSEPDSRRVRWMRRRFAWQARRFRRRGFGPEESAAGLRSFVSPLREADFADRVVMEAGCGTGRWAMAAASWGAREVLAIDFSDAVDAAFQNAGDVPNLHVVQADLHRLPLRRGASSQVDLAMTIGVLHHLDDPGRGLRALAEVTKSGGAVYSWVYAAEGNERLTRYLSPLRSRVTSRLPLPLVSGLAFALSTALHPLARVATRRGDRAHPYSEYLGWLAGLSFHHTHAVVHDHLSAPLAHYVSREEFESWFRSSGLDVPTIRHRNSNSWSGSARRRPARGAVE